MAHVIFHLSSWGGLGRSWGSFCLVFSLSFLTSIFYQFFFDFGGVLRVFWEAKMVEKSRFLVFFWICLWRPYFWSKFARFLIKSMVKNIGIFDAFPTRRFINCCLNLLIPSMLETSKIVIFCRENAYFYKISFFAFDVKRYRTCTQS